jgi:hypothetical protein
MQSHNPLIIIGVKVRLLFWKYWDERIDLGKMVEKRYEGP